MKKTIIRDHNKARELIKKAIHSTEEARLQHRLHCVLLMCDGKTCTDVAALFGDSLRIVQYWAKNFNEPGIDGLRDFARPGRNARLSETDKEVLSQDIRQSPDDFGYTQNLWDGKLLSYHINRKFGVDLKVRQCQNLFHELGFRRRKPRPLIAKADVDKQEPF